MQKLLNIILLIYFQVSHLTFYLTEEFQTPLIILILFLSLNCGKMETAIAAFALISYHGTYLFYIFGGIKP